MSIQITGIGSGNAGVGRQRRPASVTVKLQAAVSCLAFIGIVPLALGHPGVDHLVEYGTLLSGAAGMVLRPWRSTDWALAWASLLLGGIVVAESTVSGTVLREGLRTYLFVPLIGLGFVPLVKRIREQPKVARVCVRAVAFILLVFCLAVYLAPASSRLAFVQGSLQPNRGTRLHFSDATYVLTAYLLAEGYWLVRSGLPQGRRRLVPLLLVAATVLEIGTSQLRTAWLMVAVAGTYVAFTRMGYGAQRRLRIVAVTCIGCVLIVSPLRTRALAITQPGNQSAAFRSSEIRNIDIPAIKQNPFGYGVGAVDRQGKIVNVNQYVAPTAGARFPGAHSSVVFAALELGLPGLFAFVALLAIAFRRPRRSPSALSQVIIVAISSSFLISPTILVLPVAVALGLAIAGTQT